MEDIELQNLEEGQRLLTIELSNSQNQGQAQASSNITAGPLNVAAETGSLPAPKEPDTRIRRLNTQLLEAIEDRDIGLAERLLKIGANPNATCRLSHVSACHLAALTGGDTLAVLFKYDADKHRRDKHGRTPLHLAAWSGSAKDIDILMDDVKIEEDDDKIQPNAEGSVKRSRLREMANMQCQRVVIELPETWHDSSVHDCKYLEQRLNFTEAGWTPLHAASANARPDCAYRLLAAGADPKKLDDSGCTPLDVAGSACYHGQEITVKRVKEITEILVSVGGERLQNPQRVQTLEYYNSPLHVAVELESLDLIMDLLDSGVSVAYLNCDGQTPLHLCVKKYLKKHLQVLSNYKDTDPNSTTHPVDLKDKDGLTVLHAAVKKMWLPGVRVALEAGADVTLKADDGKTALDSAAALGNVEVLGEVLRVAKQTGNSRDIMNSSILYAIEGDHLNCYNLMSGQHFTAEQIVQHLKKAMKHNSSKIAKTIIDQCETPGNIKLFDILQTAVYGNSQEALKLLLLNGVALSSHNQDNLEGNRLPVINLIMRYVDKPTEFIENIFDESITTNGYNIQHPDCVITINYEILVPDQSETNQMKLLKAIIGTGNKYDQQRLLLHPLVESFLYVKWTSLPLLFYAIFLFKVLFVPPLNAYIIPVIYYADTGNSVAGFWDPTIWRYPVYVLTAIAAILEFMSIERYKNAGSIKIWLKFAYKISFLGLILAVPSIITVELLPHGEWRRHIATTVVMLSWLDVMIQFSEIPILGYYIMMMWVVLKKVVMILLIFLFVVVAFAFSFMIQFGSEKPFEDPWSAFVKTMVMMASEFDYGDTFDGDSPNSTLRNDTGQINHKNVEGLTSKTIRQILFVAYLVLAALVLMNVTVGVAVNDLHKLALKRKKDGLSDQIALLDSLESLAYHRIVPRCLISKTIFTRTSIKPHEPSDCKCLSPYLLQAIFNKVKAQRDLKNEYTGQNTENTPTS